MSSSPKSERLVLDLVQDTLDLVGSKGALPLKVRDMSTFAIQLLPEESSHHNLVKHVLKEAKGLGILFRSLKVMGPLEIGSAKFIRFDSDLSDPQPLLDAMRPERGTIGVSGKSYVMRIGEKEAAIPVSRMSTTTGPGFPVEYRGTRMKFWDRQFT